MAQPAQVKFGLPNGDWCAIDNGAAGAVSTNATVYSKGTGIGTDGGAGNMTGSGVPNFDVCANGSTAQSTNPFGDTGSVLIDASGNDTVFADPAIGTVAGNPVAGTQPTFKTVTKVLTNPLSATINWKNPA